MGMFDFLKAKKNTASIAKDRLRILIAQERTNRAGPDYLPLLQRGLLEVIRKYVSVDVDAVKGDVVKDGEHDVLDISVALPEGRAAPACWAAATARSTCCRCSTSCAPSPSRSSCCCRSARSASWCSPPSSACCGCPRCR